MNWNFLDKMNRNLLYLYTKGLPKSKSEARYQNLYNAEIHTGDSERDEMLIAEKRRQAAFYIIWFVYKYVLDCNTLEEAKKYANEETLKKYKLTSFLRKRHIYIGVYGINEIYLYKYNEGDLDIVLEILYNRYDFFEQLECFIKHTEGTARTTRNRCIKATNECLKMMDGKPEYCEIIRKYKERHSL